MKLVAVVVLLVTLLQQGRGSKLSFSSFTALQSHISVLQHFLNDLSGFCWSPDSLDSCQGRCGYGTDSSFTCQCNQYCERYNDCCSDYEAICKGELHSFNSAVVFCQLSTVSAFFLSAGSTSCKGRCGEKYNSQNKCHCNSKCSQYNNCCGDYADLCDSKGCHTSPKIRNCPLFCDFLPCVSINFHRGCLSHTSTLLPTFEKLFWVTFIMMKRVSSDYLFEMSFSLAK